MKAYFFGFLILVSFQVLASDISLKIISANPNGNFKIGIGSNVNLNSDDTKINGSALFLGSAINPSGESTYQMYLNTNTKEVNYIDSNNFSRKNSNLQTVLDPYEQQGGTCTGYAIFDYLQQTNLSKFEGTGELAKTLSTEEGRSQLLADSINQYYLTLSHRYSINGIMNGYGKKFGFKCKNFKTNSYDEARNNLLKSLSIGMPVIVSFNIGPDMVKSPFKISKYNEKNGEMDDRLWIPRKVGQKNSGGHSIVAAGSFKFENNDYLVMIDSDWSEPRIWDMNSFLNSKTALDEIEFISCK